MMDGTDATDMSHDIKKTFSASWSWLRGASRSIDGGANECREPAPGPTARLPSGPARGDAMREPRAGAPAPLACDHVGKGAVVLAFPLRGEALLVKLAELLRKRIANEVASRGPEHDPL